MGIQTIELEEMEPNTEGNAVVNINEVNLSLIKDVSVEVVVVVGSAAIKVEELFALSRGSIVALDKEVNAPVDVVLGDRVIARGILVASEDQFGVKIEEILE